MFKKLLAGLIVPLMAVSSFLSATIQYEVRDIDTLQTHSSEAIAMNNKGCIMGWYNIDGSKEGKRFFVRNTENVFHEIPERTPDAGLLIDWRFLTDTGKAYGIFSVNQSTTALCVWDESNGFVKLGIMPGKEVVSVNNAGKVLIKSVKESENGKSVTRPVVWSNGQVAKLKGLEGDLGIESEESCGFDINNKGEVVGQSLVSLIYKNNIYHQLHAVKWDKNGNPKDLHYTVPKCEKTSAKSINDNGDIVINMDASKNNILGDFVCSGNSICNKQNIGILTLTDINKSISNDYNSIWMKIVKFVSINDKREIIAEGQTIFGEKHAVLLVPVDGE